LPLPPTKFEVRNKHQYSKPKICPCEERSDEAISIRCMVDCFAALAMTYRVPTCAGVWAIGILDFEFVSDLVLAIWDLRPARRGLQYRR